MIRVVSSLSKLVKFWEKETIMDDGQPFNDILFFVKGEANIYKKLKLMDKNSVWE